MNIALPEVLKTFVHEQVAAKGYTSASEYVRELIRAAQEQAAYEEIEKLILEGLNSGPSTEITPDHWQASQITDAAIFYSRLSKWEEFFDGLPVHTIQKHVWYQLGVASLEIPPSGGHFVVDITESLQIKLEAIRTYKTQFPPGKERVFQMVAGQNQMAGASAGFAAGERKVCQDLVGKGHHRHAIQICQGNICQRRGNLSGKVELGRGAVIHAPRTVQQEVNVQVFLFLEPL